MIVYRFLNMKFFSYIGAFNDLEVEINYSVEKDF